MTSTCNKGFVSSFTPGSSRSPMLLLLVSTLLLTLIPSTTNATKHVFKTSRDHRTFIGPIGPPFGFFSKGQYKLLVKDFQLKVKDHHRRGRKSDKNDGDDSQNEYVKKLHPGFLLKRFENENDFAQFEETIYDNVTTCGFGDFINGGQFAWDDDNQIGTNTKAATFLDLDDDYYINHDDVDLFVAKGPGVIDGGKDGIFLSMKNSNQWYPNEPTLEHNFTPGEKGFYFLFYQVCLTDGLNNGELSKFVFKEVTSSFKLDFEYTNLDSFDKVSYLTAGDMPLPHIYLYFTISYLILLVMWIQSMNNVDKNSGRKPTIYAIHHLMSSVVFLKVLTMLLESIRYHYIRVKGHAEVWSFVYYITNFMKGTFLFIVILLIGSGWSFFKPHLSGKERRILLFVILLQIIDNIAVAMLAFETENERLYNDWSTVLHLVDIVSCCALLLPIVWQVNSLEESVEVNTNAEDEENDPVKPDPPVEGESVTTTPVVEGKTINPGSSRLQSKLYLFRSFYLIVVAYIYFTRIVIYLFASSLKYDQTWIRTFVYELGTLTFYFVVGLKFKPIDESYASDYAAVQSRGYDADDNEDDIRSLLPQAKSQQKQIELSSVLKGGKVAQD